MKKKRAIIVGAGPGGLAAAMLLSKAGLDVHVFEKLPRVGGRTTTWEGNGFRFDLGPTFFLYPRVLREVFALSGFDLEQRVPMVKLDPQYRIDFEDGGPLDCTPDPERMAAAIDRISPGDGAGFSRFMAENRKKLEAFRPVLESKFDSFFDLLDPGLLKVMPHLRPWNSVEQDLMRYFADPRIRLAFCFQSKYLGMSPFRCPSIFTILSHLEYEFGVWHPVGGHGAVTEGMAACARELGATFHLSEGVEEVLYEGNKAVGVRTRTGEHRADAVVVNADFARAMKEIVPEAKRPSWTDRRIDKSGFSCSTYMLYLGVEGSVDLPHHTIHIPESYERNLQEIEQLGVLSDEPSIYVQNASVTDDSLAPPGHSALYVLVPVPNNRHGIDWDSAAPAFRKRVLRRLERKMGIENLTERIRFEKQITPADWSNDHGVHLGAVFNLRHDLMQMMHRRPHNRFDDGSGMYLVGGGTHPGSGLPVIFESARISSRLLLEDLKVDFDWSRITPPVTGARRLVAVA